VKLIPCALLEIRSCSNFLLMASAIMMYNKGERGHSCFRLLLLLKKRGRPSIHQGRNLGRIYTRFNSKKKGVFKPKFMKDIKQKGVSYPVKGTCYVHFNNNLFSLLAVLERVSWTKLMLSTICIFLHKSSLILWNDFWENLLKLVGLYFCQEFVRGVTQWNRLESSKRGRVNLFRDKR